MARRDPNGVDPAIRFGRSVGRWFTALDQEHDPLFTEMLRFDVLARSSKADLSQTFDRLWTIRERVRHWLSHEHLSALNMILDAPHWAHPTCTKPQFIIGYNETRVIRRKRPLPVEEDDPVRREEE